MYGNCPKILKRFNLYVFPPIFLFSYHCFTKYLVEWQTVQTLIRLLLKEQSDQGLHCLYTPFCQKNWCNNFRIITVSEQQRSWQACTNAQARMDLCCLQKRNFPTLFVILLLTNPEFWLAHKHVVSVKPIVEEKVITKPSIVLEEINTSHSMMKQSHCLSVNTFLNTDTAYNSVKKQQICPSASPNKSCS